MAWVDWTAELETGNLLMDREHRMLVGMLNEFYEVLVTGQSCTVVLCLVDNLAQHASEHFRHEELLMRDSVYPHLAAHTAEHEKLRQQVSDFADRLRSLKQPLYSIEAVRFLTDWLVNHIITCDKDLAAHLNQRCRPHDNEGRES